MADVLTDPAGAADVARTKCENRRAVAGGVGLAASIFFDITPAIRMGLSYQRVDQKLADDTSAHNNRFEMTLLYFL
jgi:hypothetical protein